MSKLFVAMAGLAAILPLSAQDPSSKPAESRPLTREERVQAIDSEFNEAVEAFFEAYKGAETDEDRTRIFKEKYPKVETFAPRLFAIAQEDPKSEVALTALTWVVTHDRKGALLGETLDRIARDHVESANLGEIADALAHASSEKAAAFLQTIEKKSPHRNVKARALYARAELTKDLLGLARQIQDARGKAGEKLLAELADEIPPGGIARYKALDIAATERAAEEMLVLLQKQYGDVDGPDGATLGERAEGDLFELRNLAIGKVAPDIEGEDIFGKALRLSDYRGKVVVLDFWGNW